MSSICGAEVSSPAVDSRETEYDGRIEYETFVKHAKEFIALSDNLFDSWTLKQHCDDQMYLVKHQLVNNSKFKMEYELVYSVAFAVPVLYFRIFDASNGEILWDLDQIGSNTSLGLSKLQKQDSSSLTQMPHPFYQTPYFQLHPCHTAKWMEDLLSSNRKHQPNYIVAWLSFIAPHVGLVISEKYCNAAAYTAESAK